MAPAIKTDASQDLGKEALQEHDGPDVPLRRADLVCLLLSIVLCDLTIYSGEGFAGLAVLFAVAPILLLASVARQRIHTSTLAVLPMLVLIAARSVWCGDWLVVCIGFTLIGALALGLSGMRPYFGSVFLLLARSIPIGAVVMSRGLSKADHSESRARSRNWLSIVIPVAVCVVFALLFLLANPDLWNQVRSAVSNVMEAIWDWIADFVPAPMRIVFWAVVALITCGLFRPARDSDNPDDDEHLRPRDVDPQARDLFVPFRNTLVAVVALFGVYLTYEFTTVWSREFPPGSYSAYAHQGAFWLTVALAVATLLLSAIFQGRTLVDHRLPVLRIWSRVWVVENFLLAAAVYNRLHIYVEFNGMTRMRTVGLLGITAVVAGFVLVLVKISKGRTLEWLIRRDMWAVAFLVWLYAVLPVDTLVTMYNVRRIMNGDPAPSVQISVQPNSAEGLLMLEPLLDAPDETIRNGVGAMLSELRDDFRMPAADPHWSSYQMADEVLSERLEQIDALDSIAPSERRRLIQSFHDYAYQWY